MKKMMRVMKRKVVKKRKVDNNSNKWGKDRTPTATVQYTALKKDWW